MARLLFVALMVVACTGAPVETQHEVVSGASPSGDAPCGTLVDQVFKVEGRGRVRLIPNPYWKKDVRLNSYGRPCRDFLGEGWRVAPGSYDPSFPETLRGEDSARLHAALERHGFEYMKHDRVCAPCVPDAGHCPCTDRWVSNWLFCQQRD